MLHHHFILLISILIFTTGCSYRTTSFFEDIFADNTEMKADSRFTSKVVDELHAPIISTNEQTEIQNDTIKARGKIIQANFDKDFNLYVYTFLDTMTQKPVTFYYDKNIPHSKDSIFKVVVEGNYLLKIEKVQKIPKTKTIDKQYTTPIEDKSPYNQRKYKKRKRSYIKIPIEEKINTL